MTNFCLMQTMTGVINLMIIFLIVLFPYQMSMRNITPKQTYGRIFKIQKSQRQKKAIRIQDHGLNNIPYMFIHSKYVYVLYMFHLQCRSNVSKVKHLNCRVNGTAHAYTQMFCQEQFYENTTYLCDVNTNTKVSERNLN